MMGKQIGAGTLSECMPLGAVPSKEHNGVGVSTPLSITKNGTKVPPPEDKSGAATLVADKSTTKVVPPGYKQTKVGVIPEEWEVVKLGDIFYEIRDKIGENDIETYSISAGKGFVSQKHKFGKDISGDQNKNYILLQENQFAYNKGNSKSYKYGCVYPNTTGKNIAVPNVFISFDFKDHKMSTLYYAKLFEHHFLDRGLRRIISSSARMDGLLNINKKYFFELPIIKPPLKEQQKIAQILTTWDDAISKQEALIEAKEQLKKGLMQKLLSGEVRFAGFDGKWKEVRLGDIAEINPRTKSLPNSFIYIDLESVKNGILLKETTIDKKEAPSRAQRLLQKDDILFQMVRPYQKNNFYFQLNGNYVASTGYAQIRTSECSKFIYHYLHMDNFVNKVLVRCTGTGYPAINSKDLAKIKIKLPSKAEQQKISQVLTTADKEIALLKEELEVFKEQKRGLMQKLLTGEVRAKNYEGVEDG